MCVWCAWHVCLTCLWAHVDGGYTCTWEPEDAWTDFSLHGGSLPDPELVHPAGPLALGNPLPSAPETQGSRQAPSFYVSLGIQTPD